MSAKRMVAATVTWLDFFTEVNLVSQRLQRFGFMRLIWTPASLNGIAQIPRIGIGTRICDQQPLHRVDASAEPGDACPICTPPTPPTAHEMSGQPQYPRCGPGCVHP